LKVCIGAVGQLGVWAAERSAQVKEEPAGEGRRAGDTEQSTLPPRIRAAYSQHGCRYRASGLAVLSRLGSLPHIPAFVALPAGQTLWATSSYWGTRNRQSPTESTPLVAVAKKNAEHGSTTVDIELVSGVPSNDKTVNDPGAIVGGGGRRFLVPQYEADDPTGCCAANVQQHRRIMKRTPPKAATEY
jgi:hypothetical protein